MNVLYTIIITRGSGSCSILMVSEEGEGVKEDQQIMALAIVGRVR